MIQKTHEIFDLFILGSGLAGYAAALRGAEAGLKTALIDKGRRTGGRLSTKRAEGFLFNHGAQFITAKSALFRDQLSAAEQAGFLAPWHQAHGHIRYSGRPAMRGLAEYLSEQAQAAGVTAFQHQQVSHISRTAQGFKLTCDGSELEFHTRHLIVTAPAPQTAQLLREVSPAAASIADTARYHPCWTVMLGYHTPLDLADAPLPVLLAGHGIAALTIEQTRPDSDPAQMAMTIQADPLLSAEMLEYAPDDIIPVLKDRAEQLISCMLPDADFKAAHRWRYAKVEHPVAPYSPRCFIADHLAGDADAPAYVGIAGDWHPAAAENSTSRSLTGQRAEEAYLSGDAAAAAIINMFA